MNVPDLQTLQQGDPDAWDEAFSWLWPTAFAVAQSKLQPYLPGDIDDVAIEALEELVEKVQDLKSIDELKPLTASIAHHRAVSRLRQHFAVKRGSGLSESLEAKQAAGGDLPEMAAADSPLVSLEQKELAEILRELLAELKPPQGDILSDFFIQRLSYDEIGRKYGLAIGSVGVYLKRGLEAVRKACGKHPELLKDNNSILR